MSEVKNPTIKLLGKTTQSADEQQRRFYKGNQVISQIL